MAEAVRKFETGATRDTDDNKLDYEAFFSPLVLRRRAEFMHKNRYQKDNSVRDGDNWTKGMPLNAYAKSVARHYEDFRLHHRGYGDLAAEDLETALCAIMFNVEGYLYEVLSAKRRSGGQSVTGNMCSHCEGTGIFKYTSDDTGSDCIMCSGSGEILKRGNSA